MKTIKGVKHPKKIEAEYYRSIRKMAGDIYRVFRKNVDLKDFSDSRSTQISAFDKAVDKIVRRSNVIASIYTERLYKYFNRSFQKNTAKVDFGINIRQLMKGDIETVSLLGDNAEMYIEKYGNDVASWLKGAVRQNYVEGGSYSNLVKEIKERAGVDNRKAKLIARNESGNLIGTMNVKRGDDLGVKKGVWRTMKDERVRESHRKADGKVFDLKKGLMVDGVYTWPSLPIRCRCYLEYVIEGK